MHIRKLSDQKILYLAQEYGGQALLWRQRFIGLLPEVNRRKLYEKKGCNSIVEFGAKFAGLSKEQVFRALNLDRKFEDKPVLKNLFESGEVSMNKLVRVASIATKENEEILAENVKLLSKSALEVFVKDEKNAIKNLVEQKQGDIFKNQDGFGKPIFGSKSVPGHNLQLEEDVRNELHKLQQKGIDINQLLREFLKKRTEEIETEKQRLSEIAQSRHLRNLASARQKAKKMQEQDHAGNKDIESGAGAKSKKPSRYKSVAVQKVLLKEYGSKCGVAACYNPIDDIHHAQRWGLAQVHDPKQMAPLCKQHHEIAHTLDLSYHKIKHRRELWQK